MKDSTQLAKEWEEANPERCRVLNDMLEGCPDRDAKRALFATFSDEEKNGVILEYCRRRDNKRAPTGSLVKPKHRDRGISIIVGRGTDSVTHVSHFGLAIVMGYEYGDHMRHVMLMPAWRNLEGRRIMFGEACLDDIEMVT